MKAAFYLFALALALFAIYCAILMTEPGQMIGVPRDWLLNYYRYMPLFWTGQVVALVILWVANIRGKFWKPIWMWLALIGVLITFWAQSYAMPTAFPTEQLSAAFYTVDEADRFIPREDTRVYVVDIDGDTRIFPRYHLQVPHVAGWESDGASYAIAYCGLSNLPMVVETNYGLGDSNLQVLGQAHNNLIFKDVENGTAFQQITMQSEFTHHQATLHPNTMMTWEIAKKRYPEAKVYLYAMDRLIDKIMLGLFEKPLQDQRSIENPDFIFDTLDLEDARLNPKQEIFGYNDGTQQVAIDPDFARANNGYVLQLSGKALTISTDGEVVQLLDSSGQQVPIHNGIHYGIWSQFFPATKVIK